MIKFNNRVGKKRAISSISSISLVLSAIAFVAILVFNSTTATAVTGVIDTSFDPGTGLNATSYSIVPLPDGKTLIGGGSTTYNGVARNRIARINADGSLDTSFDPGTGANDVIYATSVQPDGKILIGGIFTTYNGVARNHIARLNADGSLDTSFSPGTGANNTVKTAKLLPDGKILIGGSFTSYNGTSRSRIARLNADGSLDTSFSPGTGANNTVNYGLLQADGKILIGGNFTTYNGTSRSRIVRINADGSLDTSFSPGTGADQVINTMLLQPDGKILIGGNFTTYNGVARNRIARINADGSLDTSFDPGAGADAAVNEVLIQPDGRAIIVGWFNNYGGAARKKIARINADGSLDTSFDPGAGANSAIQSAALLPNGKILIGGIFILYGGTARNRIARITSYTPAPTSSPDLVAATDTGSSTTDNITKDATPDFSMICTDGDTVTLYIDSVASGTILCDALAVVAMTAPSTLSDGAHTITYTVSTDSGESAESPSLNITIDTDEPANLMVGLTVETPYSFENPHIVWSATDAGSGIDYYQLSLDGGAFATLTSPQSPSLIPGASHQVVVRAYDNAGNMSERLMQYPPLEVIYAPTTVHNTAITDTTIDILGPAGMNITAINITGAGSSGFSCDKILPAEVPIHCDGGQITSSGTLHVSATNDIGVTTSNSIDYTIDTSAPIVTVATLLSTSSTPNISGSIDDPDATVTVTVDGQTHTATNNGDGTWTLPGTSLSPSLTDDIYDISVNATDVAGNGSSDATTNELTIDTVAPNVTVNQAALQADPTNIDIAMFDVHFSEPIQTSTFDIGDVLLSGTTGTITSFSQIDNQNWEFIVTGMTSGETVIADIVANVALDVVGNGNGLSTSTDNQITYDTSAPIVTVATLLSTSSTPNISGSIDDPDATVTVTVDGQTHTATNNGDGTWTLPGTSLSPSLTDDIYDISVNATDVAGNGSSDATTNELTIDTVAPIGSISAPTATITNSPGISGSIDDPDATVTVTVDGQTHTATNNGDGTWTLPVGVIAPALTTGDYSVTVSFTDVAGNNASATPVILTILRPDADLPTITAVTWVGGNPRIQGTYDNLNSQSLSITVSGSKYVLGTSPQLTTSGNQWTLQLSGLAPGSYDILVQVTTRAGSVLGDNTSQELTIQAVSVSTVAQGLLAPNTGFAIAGKAIVGRAILYAGTFLTLTLTSVIVVLSKRRRTTN